jgi:hypothetical protein
MNNHDDTVLITLKDETTILFDSNIRETSKDADGNQIYDVMAFTSFWSQRIKYSGYERGE